ncbi:unnamed protein product, partial [Phaeothamnion confervicola]
HFDPQIYRKTRGGGLQMKRRLKLSISSLWRVGSGKGSGPQADELVLRDAQGLPFVPGRALKGLLRDAMELASLSGSVAPERITKLFGSALPQPGKDQDQDQQMESGRFSSEEGELWIGSAKLPETWNRWVESTSEEESFSILSSLFTHVSSTAIDANGVAAKHSLRVAEVAMPMDLGADIQGAPNDESWAEDIKKALPLLRALGSRRNRGYGRVDVTLEEVK